MKTVTAERFYRQVIERDPDDITTLNNLAYLLVHNGRRFDQALPIIEHAVDQLVPNHPDLLDTKGQVLIGLGSAGRGGGCAQSAPVTLRPRDMNDWFEPCGSADSSRGRCARRRIVLEDVGSELGVDLAEAISRIEAAARRSFGQRLDEQ